MKHFAFTCQGESHKATNKPCQDYSYSSVEGGVAIAVVCDGHGGERYFRSDVGSRLCVEITVEAIRQFVVNVDETLFVGKPDTRRKTIAEMEGEKLSNTDNALRQLFSSIIVKWNQEIEAYTNEHPVTDEEKSKVPERYIEAFLNGQSLEKTYGCTLMAYVQTPKYWFAFHIGDGKCVSFHNEAVLWREPIEWDERCFLNKTTSICDSDALSEFRYTYCGDGTFPVAVYLGSDGMDDSFGPMENLVEFYMQVSKMLAKNNDEEAKKSIMETLPVLSKRGSQDDMSLAYVYDESRLYGIVNNILNAQIARLRSGISVLKNRIDEETYKYKTLQYAASQKDQIERDYAQKNIARLKERLDAESKKLETRLDELHPKRSSASTCGRRRIPKTHFKRQLNKRIIKHKNHR